MALEVPEGVQGLFLVLTGERWPTANEDFLREVANAWGTAGHRLETEMGPYLVQAVNTIRNDFTGKSAIKFADMMAPYAAEPPYYIPQAAEQFQQLKKFLLNAATQVEYVKIISIEELILLIAQIAWAIAMAFWTDGASMTWLAARMAIVRFLLKTLWGRLILQFVLAELFGIAFQLALDVLTQAIQFAKHTRTEWDVQATISAVEVGAVGGALSLPFAAIGHFVAHQLTKALSKIMSREISVTVLQPLVVRAVNQAARNMDNAPISEVAKNITGNLFKAADKPLRVRLTEIGVPVIVKMVEEGLHEAITEGVVMAANGQGFQFNPYSFTSGAISSLATQTGHGIGASLKALKGPQAQGYVQLDDGGETDGESLLSDSSSDLSDTETGGASTVVTTPSSTRPSSPAPSTGGIKNTTTTSMSSAGAPSRGSASTADVVRNGSSAADRGAGTTPPPVPPKDTVSASSRSETPPPVPPKDGRSDATTATRGNGASSPSIRSTAEGDSRPSSSPTTSTSRLSGTNGRPAESSPSTSVPSSRGRTGANDGSSPSTSPRSGGRTTGEPATASSNGGASGSRSGNTSSTTGGTPSARSSSETPKAGNDSTARRDGTSSDNPFRSRSETQNPASTSGGTKPAGAEGTREAGAGARQESNGRRGETSASRSNGGPPTAPSDSETKVPNDTRGQTGRAQNTDPFRSGTQAAETNAASSHTRLPEEVTKDAATVPAEDLSSVLIPLGDRLVVTGRASVSEVQAAVRRLGVDVVARVDREQVGNGRRKGVQWMRFPAGGGRPRPVHIAPGPIATPAWSQTRLGDDAIKRDYPWLPKINPGYVKGGDFLTNCLLAAIGVDLTLEEARLDPTEDPGLLPFYRVPPDARSPYEYLANMDKGEPVDVPGYHAIADAVRAAGPGARGMVLVGTQGTDIDHIFNVVHDGNGVVFLDGQKGVQADLPANFRSLQFLPTSEDFPRHTIAVNPTPWQHGRFIGGEAGKDGVENRGARTGGREPFSGPGVRLGHTDGRGAAIPGVDNAVREESAARRAEAEAKAKAEGKDPRGGWRPVTPRRDARPVTIDDVVPSDVRTEPRQSPEPFGGEGRRLGKGEGTGIPGLSEKERQEAEDRRAKAQKKTPAKSGPGAKGRPRPAGRGGARDAVTINDLPPETKPEPFPGPGHTLGKGDGKGAGIPGLSNETREKSAAERLQRPASSQGTKPPGTTTPEPFSGTGRTLGEGDGTGTGIPGLTEEERLAAEARRVKAQQEQAQQEQETGQDRATPARRRRTGKGFGGEPATMADLPEDRPQEPFPGTGEMADLKEEEVTGRAPGDRRTAEDPRAPERFPGEGKVVGEGDGRGAAIPGLDNETREKAAAGRAKRRESGSKRRRVYTPPKKQVTFADLREEETAGEERGRSSGARGRFQQQRGAGTTTLVEEQPKPAKNRDSAGTGTAPVDLDTGGPATARKTTAGQAAESESASDRGAPPPYAAVPSNGGRSSAAESSAAKPSTRSSSPPPPYTPSETAEQGKAHDDEEVAEARATLASLDGQRRELLLDQAGTIVGDLSGHVAAAGSRQGLSPVGRAALRVAAELASAGRAAAERLARELVRDLTHKPEPQRVPRVTIDNDRVQLARTTLDLLRKFSEKQTVEVLNEARVIVESLAGRRLSLGGRGQAHQLTMVWLLAAAEIPWSGHRAAADLVADLLGVPRSTPGSPSRYAEGFAAAAKNDPGRARATLALRADVTAKGILAAADTILRKTEPLGEGDERARRRDRLVIAAEIARSGPDAGRALAEELAAHAVASAARAAEPRKKVAWADDVNGGEDPKTRPETNSDDPAHGSHGEESEDEESEDEEWEDEEWEDEDHEHGPDLNTAPHQTEKASSTASEHMPIEELFGETRVGMVDGRTAALWLPGACEKGPEFDLATLQKLSEVIPNGTVFVFGTVKDGKVLAGGREISVEALAAIIAGRAPGMRPLLLMSGGGAVAEPLSRALDEPVLATPYEAEFDPRTGAVVSHRSAGVQSEVDEKAAAQDTWFRVYTPGDSKGMPIFEGLGGAPENVKESKNGKSDKKDKSGKNGKSGDDEADGKRRKGSRGQPDDDPGSEPPSSGGLGHGKRPEREKAPKPPDPGDPAQPVLMPILADPMARSIGVPRAGLPMMAELIQEIRDQLDARRVQYTENEINLLAHRLLANYPYLLGGGKKEGTDGLMVPIGGAELLVTLDADDPHELRNPGGSTLVPSDLPKVDDEHHAVDTINATYATGAHVQTQSGQTGATRGALSVSFGVGVTPGILQVVKFSASISGTTNQSNRSTTHIADAEGGHVEDNRIDANLVSYTPRWSFKLRTDPNAKWEKQQVHRPDTEESAEKLLLWIPQHYLKLPPSDQVTAVGKEVKSNRLPSFYVASGLTNIPKLFDEIVDVLAGQGLDLPIGSMTRQELLHKLWNLNAHLDDAVNLKKGYRITLHNKYGRPIARVKVNSQRLVEEFRRVGTTSDKAHIENVRTAIDGTSGGHTVTNTSSLTFPSVEFDLVPNPTGIKGLGLGVSTGLTYTSTNAEGISTGRVGLNVLVPRNTSHTTAYAVRFDHTATVSVRGRRRENARKTIKPVRGEALLRMPEAAAYDHGFSVDRGALKEPQPGQQNKWKQDAIRGTGRRDGDDEVRRRPPNWVRRGRGVGMGLVMVDDETVSRLEREIKAELRDAGFLPADEDDPFAGYSRFGHGNKTDSLIDNLELVDKMVSSRGLDSHYDQIHQDGMTFTLRKRTGGAGVDIDVDSARVTIKAKRGANPKFVRTTDEYHTVNLAMGMDSAGMSVTHSRKIAWGVKLKGLFFDLKGATMGMEWQRTVGATDSVNMLNNRPELLEYPGLVDEFALTSDYTVTIEYQHSGRLRRGVRDAEPIAVKGQVAKAFLLPLGTTDGPESAGPTPREVLDQGVVYFLDTTGAREHAGRALRDIIGPAGTADLDVSTFASTIELRSHMKEILAGQYTTDRPFDPGLFRDKFGAIDIRGNMGKSKFTGATSDKFVLGVIKLWLTEGKLTDNNSTGWTWDQLDIAVGGPTGEASMTGEADATRHWQHNRSKSSGRSGGKELIQLDFNRVYSYQTTVNLQVRGRREKHSKLWPSGDPRHSDKSMPPRVMVYLLPEPEALTRYAEGTLPVSSAQLADAMARWEAGELRLSGDVVAKILARWLTERPDLPDEVTDDRPEQAAGLVRQHEIGGVGVVRSAAARADFHKAYVRINPDARPLQAPADPYDTPELPEKLVDYLQSTKKGEASDEYLADAMEKWMRGRLPMGGDAVASILLRWQEEVPDLPESLGVDRNRFATRLAELNDAGALPIRSLHVRERFNFAFWQSAGEAPVPFEHMEMPEYLTRDDPNGRFLGHSGVQDLLYNDGRSTYDLVRQKVEAVAPGMLAAGAEAWTGDGRRIGKMQGTVDALQSIFARGRDQAMWEDVLAKGGYSIYLVHPVGWLLSDVVEINLADVLTSQPEVYDFKPNTGLEDYGHGYVGTSRAKSRDGSQAVVGKLAASGTSAGGDGNLKAGEGHHRGTTHAENAVTEQTVYDWSGHYCVRFQHRLTVTARRLKMPGRPLNNLLMEGFKKWTLAGREATDSFDGTLNLQVPRALAEAGQIRGPAPMRDVRTGMKLPHNAYVTGLNIDLLETGRSLMGRLLGPRWYERALGAKANDENTRSSLSLPVLLSRSHLTNHVREAIGGDRYKLADDLFIPGDSSSRATMWLDGELYDTQVIGRMKEGTGTGRYIKHQSGTTQSNSTDLNRVTAGYDVSGNGSMTDHNPETPQNTWGFNDSGNRTTSMNQASSGTENYRREQHAKEQGATVLLRMRGQFWLEAQKTSHHFFSDKTNDGRPVRSDPVTGDVYVEMFEAQYEELLAEMAKDEQRLEAQRRLRRRVDPDAWHGLYEAEPVDVTSLLAEAASENVSTAHALDHLVRRIREERGAGRPLVLDFDRSETRRFHALANWAVATMTADLQEIQKAAPATAEPAQLDAYRQYLRSGGLPKGMAENQVDDQITAIINVVNKLHERRPDNRYGAPAALPPEASVLSLDPLFLSRDIAHELTAHALVRVRRLDGTWQQRWVDPSGRIHAFDPMTVSGMLLSVKSAVDAGLMSQELGRDVVNYGLTEVELGLAYDGSWDRQQTFEQAINAQITERRRRMEAVHPALPQVFDRIAAALSDWTEEEALFQAEAGKLQAEAKKPRPPVEEDSGAVPDPQQDKWERRAWQQHVERTLAKARERREEAKSIFDALAATLDRKVAVSRVYWTDDVVLRISGRLEELEELAVRRRLSLGFREWRLEARSAFGAIEARLRRAGEGSLSYVTNVVEPDGIQVFKAVYHQGKVHWFASPAETPVSSPAESEQQGIVRSFDLGPGGRLLEPEDVHWRNGAVEFGSQREFWLVPLRGHLALREPAISPSISPALSRSGTLAEFQMLARAMTGDGSPSPSRPGSRPQTPALMIRPRRIVELGLARLGRLPAEPHVYRHDNGQYGIGPAGRHEDHWDQRGALADYAPVLWLTHDDHTASLTVEDVALVDLDGAVDFLRDLNTTEQVRRLFAGFGRNPERTGQLPSGLPEGTWIWYASQSGTGAMVVTSEGFLVHGADDEQIAPQPEARVRARFGAQLHRFVIGRPPAGGRAEQPAKPKVVAPSELAVKAEDTVLPPAAASPQTTLDFPLPNDPQLYINNQGDYRVAAPGTGGEWNHLGALVEYAPISWLLGSRTSQGVTAADVAHHDLAQAEQFLDAVARAQDTTEAIRSFLERVSGRRVEVARTLPEDLPGGTWIYFVGGNRRGAAAVVLPDGRIQRLIEGAVQTSASRMTGGVRGTFVIARPKTSVGQTGRSRSASEPRTAALMPKLVPGRRRGGSTSGPLAPTTPKKPAGTTTPKGTDRTGTGEKGTGEKGTAQKETGQSGLSDKALGKRLDVPHFKSNVVEEAAAHALEQEWLLNDPDVLTATLKSLGLTAIEVPGDNNCFYHTLIAVAGPYLAQAGTGVLPGRRDRPGVRANIRLLRAWLADRLEADFEVAAQGLPSRYAEFFHMDDRTPIRDQQAEHVRRVRQMDSWNNEVGDAIAEVAARELGLPMRLIQGRYQTNMGPDSDNRIYFIRTPGHYRGARRTDQAAIDTTSLRPEQPSTVARAQQRLNRENREQRGRLEAATALLHQVLGDVTNQPADVLGVFRDRAAVQAAALRHAEQARNYANVPAHLRAERRITDMRRAALNVEELIVELAIQFPALLTLRPEIMARLSRLLEEELRRVVRGDPGYLQRHPVILQLFPSLGGGQSS